MTTHEKNLTLEEFWLLTQQPDYDGNTLELIHGDVYIMTPSGLENAEIAGTILRLLGNYVAEHKLGQVTGADGGFQINENTVLVPADVHVVWNAFPEGQIIDVVTLGETGQMIAVSFTSEDTITGVPVLPEFKVSVKDLFA